MKKFLFAVAAASVLLSIAAYADGVGTVNIGRIMESSKAATSIRSQVEAKKKDFQSQLDSKGKELQAEQQNLLKQKDSVDKAAFEKKVADFKAKEASAQKAIQDKSVQLDKAVNDALAQIQQTVTDITKDVAGEKKLSVVVTSSNVVYADPSLDVTDEVLKRLDAKLPNVSVKF